MSQEVRQYWMCVELFETELQDLVRKRAKQNSRIILGTLGWDTVDMTEWE